MVQLVTSAQFGRTNPVESFVRGKQQAQIAELNELKLGAARGDVAAQEQLQILQGQILGGQAPQQAPAGSIPTLGAQSTVPGVSGIAGDQGVPVAPQQGPALTPGGGPTQQRAALRELAVRFPERFEAINKNLGLIVAGDERETAKRKQEARDFAFDLQTTPFAQRDAKIDRRAAFLTANNRDPKDSLSLKGLSEQDQNSALLATQAAALPTSERIEFLRGGKAPSQKEVAEIGKLRAETDQIRQKIAAGGPVSETDIKVLQKEREETVKINTKRIGELEQGSKGRTSSVVKAKQFRRALVSGERTSGTSRTVAGFFPGVFTDQAEFDQKFDSFSEVAARAKLKALGEIKPTDADVEGMKRALFGKGRDEPVNIQLLSDFIEEQENLDAELEDLRSAKSAGKLDSFVGFDQPAGQAQALFSSTLNREITEQDIIDTLQANPGVTRERLLQQLGVGVQ